MTNISYPAIKANIILKLHHIVKKMLMSKILSYDLIITKHTTRKSIIEQITIPNLVLLLYKTFFLNYNTFVYLNRFLQQILSYLGRRTTDKTGVMISKLVHHVK